MVPRAMVLFSKNQEIKEPPSLTKVLRADQMIPSNMRKINARCVLVLMIQIPLVALAELPEFNMNFVAVINVLSIFSRRNALNKFPYVSRLFHIFRSERYIDDFLTN